MMIWGWQMIKRKWNDLTVVQKMMTQRGWGEGGIDTSWGQGIHKTIDLAFGRE